MLEDQQHLKLAIKSVKHQRVVDELALTAARQELDEVNTARTYKYKQ